MTRVILDLDQVVFLDSSGVSALVAIWRTVLPATASW